MNQTGGERMASVVPDHGNDLGDWCPYSGTRTANGTCPQYCLEADEITGFNRDGDSKAEADKRRRRADNAAFRWLKKRNPSWDAERIRHQIARSHVIEKNPGLTNDEVDREVRFRPGNRMFAHRFRIVLRTEVYCRTCGYTREAGNHQVDMEGST